MSDGINKKPVDRFTLLHFLGGVVAGRYGRSVPRAVALGIAWEVVERPLKKKYPHVFPHPEQDSFDNAAMDVAAVGAGAAVGKRLRR